MTVETQLAFKRPTQWNKDIKIFWFMQIPSFLNTGGPQATTYALHMSKRGTGAIVPLECDSEVRSEIASSWIWRSFVAVRGTGEVT